MCFKDLIKAKMGQVKCFALTATAIGTAAALGVSQLAGSSAMASESGIGENAVLSTDFSEHEVGEGVPEGWVELFNSSDYEIAESPSRLVKTSTNEPRHVLAWEEVGEVEGDVEIATLIRVPDHTLPEMDTTAFQVHLHSSGEHRAINTYHVDYTGSERQGLRIRSSVDHSQSTEGTALEPFELHTWHHLVFQREGDMLRAKMWPYFTDEPDEWTVEAESDLHDSGRVGIGFYQARHTQEFAWFSVGTGDQEAERAPDNLEGISPPQVPDEVELDGEAKHGSVVLNWPEVEGADHYEIERDGELIAHGWDNSSYSDPNVEPETPATYRVRGVSALEGEGEWSEELEIEAAPLPDELVLPFEQEDGNPWTTHEQELAFLDELEEVSSRVEVEEIGRSGEGRPIHMVRVGVDGPPSDEEIAERPTAFIASGNHGNEKGPQESILMQLRELATSEDPEVLDFLDTYAVLVVPKINPDGAEANIRETVIPNTDPNRTFVSLITSEAQVITKAIRDYQPDVIIDAHEWAGSPGTQRGEFEVSAQGNLNVYEDVRNLSSELAFDRIMAESNNSLGFRSSPYQELYGEPSRLRQIGGLKHALNLLTEGSRHPEIRRLEEASLSQDDPEFRPRRVESQRFALDEAMRWMTENVDRVTDATSASAAAAKANEGPLYTGGSVAEAPSPSDILDPPPCGWLVSGADEAALNVLDLHGIEWENRTLPRPTTMGQEVMFVPAAQLARPLAVVALDGASVDQLDSVSSLRLEEESGWCDPSDPVDKTELQNRVDEINAENLNEEDYTEESWQALQDALADAENVLDNPDATQEEIDNVLENLNEARAGLEDTTPISAASIRELVEHFEDEGEFETDEAARSLLLHLTAVSQFENQEAAEKVIKHMEGFKALLNHQQEHELISDEAFDTLQNQADDLIESWQ